MNLAMIDSTTAQDTLNKQIYRGKITDNKDTDEWLETYFIANFAENEIRYMEKQVGIESMICPDLRQCGVNDRPHGAIR